MWESFSQSLGPFYFINCTTVTNMKLLYQVPHKSQNFEMLVVSALPLRMPHHRLEDTFHMTKFKMMRMFDTVFTVNISMISLCFYYYLLC